MLRLKMLAQSQVYCTRKAAVKTNKSTILSKGFNAHVGTISLYGGVWSADLVMLMEDSCCNCAATTHSAS